MNCDDARGQIELLAMDGLDAAQRGQVEAHVSHCPDCAALLQEYRLLAGDMRAACPAQATDSLHARVRFAVHAEVAGARRRVRSRRVMVAAAAAALLLVGVAIWQAVSVFTPHGQDVAPNAQAQAQPPVIHVSLKEVWRHAGAPTSPASDATAAVARGNTLFLLLLDGEQARVSSLDAQTGELKWQSSVESLGYLAADEDRVYCLAATDHGLTELVALDAASGAVQWRFMQQDRTRPLSPCRPVVMSDGRVCWTTNSTLHMLKASSGEPLWSRSIPQEGLLSAAAATPDGIYVASAASLYCLSHRDGDILWRQGLGGEFSRLGRPIVQFADGRVYAAMRNRRGGGQVICLDTASHSRAWSKAVPQVSQLQLADGRLFVRGQDVWALDLESGELLWSARATGCGPVTVAGGTVYYVDTAGTGRLVALDPKAGQAVWDMAGLQSCEAFLTLPNCGVGYFKAQDGVLRAMTLAGRS